MSGLTAQDAHFQVAILRGLCGGCLFAFPMIYTMEMWWVGYSMPTTGSVLYLAVAFVFAFGLNALSGYREAHGIAVDIADAVVSLALGLIVAAVALVTLGEVTTDTSSLVALRQIVVLAVPVSMGVSLARAQLGGSEEAESREAPPGLSHRLGVTIAGALLLGMSVAPTEELRMIVSRVSWPHLVAMTSLSLGLTWATLFVAGFPSQGVRRKSHHQAGEVLLVHAIGLAMSASMLGALGFLSGDQPVSELLAMMITLALPATVGAAAGRLIV